MMRNDNQINNAVTYEANRALNWFSSLTGAAEGGMADQDAVKSLGHAVRFYGIYAATLDDRYLTLTESFLKFALEDTK